MFSLRKMVSSAVSLTVKQVRHFKCKGKGDCGVPSQPKLFTDAYCSPTDPRAGMVLVCDNCDRIINAVEVSLPPFDPPKHDNTYFESYAVVEAVNWFKSVYYHLGKPQVLTDCQPAQEFLSGGKFKPATEPLKSHYNPLLVMFRKIACVCPFDFPKSVDREKTLFADWVCRYGPPCFWATMKAEFEMAKLIDLKSFFETMFVEKKHADLYLADSKIFYGGLGEHATEVVSDSPGHVVVFPMSVVCDILHCSNPLPVGRVMKYLDQCYSLKTHLRNIASMTLYSATRLILLLNNNIVKDFSVGADHVGQSFFVISFSTVKPIPVPFGKDTHASASLLKELKLADHFGPKENVLVYTGFVLRDSLMGKKLPGKFLVVIAANPVEDEEEEEEGAK